MSLGAGTRLGPYEIQAPLGAILGNLSTLREAAAELESGAGSIEKAARLCGQGKASAAVRALTEVQVRDIAANVRDLWAHKDLGKLTGSFAATVPSHGVVMVTIKP